MNIDKQQKTEEHFAESRTRKELENGYYYLLDLERSLPGGIMTYWKANRRGYTQDIRGAGIYSEDEALQIALEDQDKNTLLVKFKTVKNILLAIK